LLILVLVLLSLSDDRDEWEEVSLLVEDASHKLRFMLEVAREGMNRSDVPKSVGVAVMLLLLLKRCRRKDEKGESVLAFVVDTQLPTGCL
jgi:hypothetical protein